MKIPNTHRQAAMDDFKVEDGILYIIAPDNIEKIYVPEQMRETMIKEIHSSVISGHVSSSKMIQMLERRLFWGALRRDVRRS